MVAASIKVMVVADDPDERSDLAALVSTESDCLVIEQRQLIRGNVNSPTTRRASRRLSV